MSEHRNDKRRHAKKPDFRGRPSGLGQKDTGRPRANPWDAVSDEKSRGRRIPSDWNHEKPFRKHSATPAHERRGRPHGKKRGDDRPCAAQRRDQGRLNAQGRGTRSNDGTLRVEPDQSPETPGTALEKAELGRLPRVDMRTHRRGCHPWIFRKMLGAPQAPLEPGTLVEAFGKTGDFIGRGLYNPESEIALRLLSEQKDVAVDQRWFRLTIDRAVNFRHKILRLQDKSNAYRLIHSEGDGLSGLVVDRFGTALVVEVHCAGMYRHLDWVTSALKPHFPEAMLVVRVDERTVRLEKMEMPEMHAPEKSSQVVIREHGLKFHVDLRGGHKTGFFVDQRENRARLCELSKGQDVFDGCCYTGGFALNAMKGGARSVEAVDLDETVIEIAEKNRALNDIPSNLTFRHANVFEALRTYRAAGRKFTRAILDPSKQTLRRDEVGKALTNYADMNRLAMECLRPGGILLTCSCTGLVSEEQFLMALQASAAEARVDFQIFAITGAGMDHPHTIRAPEGRYLKAVWGRVKPMP